MTFNKRLKAKDSQQVARTLGGRYVPYLFAFLANKVAPGGIQVVH